ncbi:hypothetical protein CR152_27120 [Massilia violaceinigra]|uniref:histidine kinase n=1 Tax=Massilia violaceinigra TaxID=2045208 RepID=A0A2D2DVY6_9BURK|nr:hypothetical protein CR152_27120 [Massilia violaceinigra]
MHVNYRAMLARLPDNVILIDVASGCLVDANHGAYELFGMSEQMLLTRAFVELCPPCQPDGQASAQLLATQIERALAGQAVLFEAHFLPADGREMRCEVRRLPLPPPHAHLVHARFVDVTRRVLDEELRRGQNRLLDMIARGAPLKDILDSLMLLIERQCDGVLCSVMLLDDDSVTVHPASGPSLPADYLAALDGAMIGPSAGSCGTAIYRGETVIVTDVMSAPLWDDYRALIAPHGLRACWSTPIRLDRDRILGSFTMYYRDVRAPGQDELRLIGVATHLAAIAIERTRREAELSRHRDHLQELEVLTHLVDNCLVHAFADDARGTIVIGASAGPEASVVVSVADNGAGIAPPLLPRVYDPFVTTRLGSGGSGLGLGLHVVHNIVSGVLGGTIELDSELDKGSTFRLRLPVIAPAMSRQDSD